MSHRFIVLSYFFCTLSQCLYAFLGFHIFDYSISYFSGSFKSELQAVISACRRTRSYVEYMCCNLINEAVTVMDVSNPSNS